MPSKPIPKCAFLIPVKTVKKRRSSPSHEKLNAKVYESTITLDSVGLNRMEAVII